MNRLKAVRESLNVTQSKLAELIGVTSSYISQAERGDKDLGRELLLKLRELFSVNIDWFLTGEGPMFIDDKTETVSDLDSGDKTDTASVFEPTEAKPETVPEKSAPSIRVVSPSEISGKQFLVPLLDQKVSAGRGSDLPEADEVVAYIPAPAYLSRYGKDVAALQVRGDSMEPTLKNGDLVVCDTYGWQGDGVYVIRMDGEGFVKRLTRRPGRLVVISDNSAYHPFEESLESKALSVVGRVRCAVRKME